MKLLVGTSDQRGDQTTAPLKPSRVLLPAGCLHTARIVASAPSSTGCRAELTPPEVASAEGLEGLIDRIVADNPYRERVAEIPPAFIDDWALAINEEIWRVSGGGYFRNRN